ncbi:MAG: DnaJ domain-containing protein [Ruaniaceae bacterium]|nr:DnaJ domain-containing protein [Ruaniaceae bacterium]
MSGQDWMEKDFYAKLGVDKSADASEIKKAYRKLAKKYHPDRNPGDAAAEATFKEIGEAYAVLSDEGQRKQYDAIRAMAGGGARFTSGPSGAGGAAGFEDILGGMFGGGGGGARYQAQGADNMEDILRMFTGGGAGGRSGGGFGGFGRQQPQKGADAEASTSLPFRTAAEGAQVQLTINGKPTNVRIPAGVHEGQKIRLRGKGQPGAGGGPAGDLVITVHVEPHPLFSLAGNNLKVTVPVSFAEAVLGATIEVPTLEGASVKVKVPAGTPSGRTLRVKNRGVTTSRGKGDLHVTVEVAVPRTMSGAAKKAVEAFADATAGDDPRAGLMEAARR